jgi:hypothetical protein
MQSAPIARGGMEDQAGDRIGELYQKVGRIL